MVNQPGAIEGGATALGMWRYGNDYRSAAVFLLGYSLPQPFMPYYSLFGQSIELFLKAFLLAKGIPLKKLRQKFRHNLKRLSKRARESGIDSHVELSPLHWAVVDLLSAEYKNKRFQYFHPGQVILPDLNLIHEATERLNKGVKAYCDLLDAEVNSR